MPLLEVLDPQSGIGFGQSSEDKLSSNLTDGLHIQEIREKKGQNIGLSPIEQFLNLKILRTQDKSVMSISLEEVEKFKESNTPVSQGCMFSVLNKGESLLLYEFSGSSAINMLNRFTYLDQNLEATCKRIHEIESQLLDQKKIAEVCHIPEQISANLLVHKPIRNQQVTCALPSGKNDSIPLSKINIRILNNEIYLFNSRTGDHILPILSSPINFNRNGIDVYRFLGALQFHRKSASIGFSWMNLINSYDIFPRVVYKNIVISPSIWKVRITDKFWNNLQEENFENSDKISAWLKSKSMSHQLFMTENPRDDYKLYIDFRNPLAYQIFAAELKKKKTLFLIECLMDRGTPFQDSSNKFYFNEIILPYISVDNASLQNRSVKNLSPDISYTFQPGSEWVYFKLYGGASFLNYILSNHLYPLCERLIEQNKIAKWFYIRYKDTGFHLRFRVELINSENISEVISEIYSIVNNYSQEFGDVKIEPYKREVDRYGASTITECESFFHYDSIINSSYHKLPLQVKDDWIFGSMCVNNILELFGVTLKNRLFLINHVSEAFQKEFIFDKKNKGLLNLKYNERQNILTNVLSSESENYAEFQAILNLNRHEMQKLSDAICNKIKHASKKNDLLLSLIHMSLNRLFIANPRKQEMVLYYSLTKAYRTLINRT